MSKTEKRCLNCNSIVEGEYCSHCGQPVNSSRVSPKHLVEELQYGILHINKGILYTTKELLVRPGSTIKNYLSGKRIKYSKPFIFLIIWGAVYSITFHFFHFFPMEEMNSANNEILEYIPLYHWASAHYSLIALFLMPIYALSFSLLFHKKGYNYTEHLVAFAYLQGAEIFLILLSYPLIYSTKSVFIYQGAHMLARIYMVWGLVQFFRTSSWLKAIAKVVLGLLLSYLIFIILVFIVFEILKYYGIRL